MNLESASNPQPERRRITRIMVPTDFSECSLEAVRLARRFSQAHGAAMTLVHVAEPLHVDWKADTQALQREAHDEARKQLEQIARMELADCEALSVRFLTGDPVAEIIQAADREQAQLIVMGTRGRGGIGRVLLGSVAERVVRQAHCSVLVAR